MRVSRTLASGTVDAGVLVSLAWMAIVTVVTFVVAERLVRRRLLA